MESASIHFTAASGIEGSSEALSESVMMRLGETQAATGKHSEAKITYAGFLERFKESRWRRNAAFGLAYATDLSGNSADAIPLYQALVSSDNIDLLLTTVLTPFFFARFMTYLVASSAVSAKWTFPPEEITLDSNNSKY